jgi:DNA-binding CsgD family transcriptional regulator
MRTHDRRFSFSGCGKAASAFCRIVPQHGKVFISFNDNARRERLIGMARQIFGFSAAQAQLALLIAPGSGLNKSAERLGGGVNTVRTHFRRMFDRNGTGAHSQSTLMGLLLSAEAPAVS